MKKKFLPVLLSITIITTGCSGFLPKSGPTKLEVYSSAVNVQTEKIEPFLTIIELNPKYVALMETESRLDIREFNVPKYSPYIGKGDVVEIIIQEQYPPVLFIAKDTPQYVVPAQIVTEDGIIVPYIGRIRAEGKTTTQLADEIRQALKGKANNPQVLIRQLNAESSYVTVLGAVKESRKVQLGYNITTILDAIAQVGGVTSPVEKTVVQIDRKGKKLSIPLNEIIKNPDLNLNLMPGDVLTVVYKSQTAIVLGTTNKNEEIEFEAKGITLNQLLARSGGLNPNLSDAKGVFIFRFEDKDIINKLGVDIKSETDKGIPVIYNVDLTKPENFFAASKFKIKDGDVLYVATAPSIQYQQFLSIISNTISPIFMINRMSK